MKKLFLTTLVAILGFSGIATVSANPFSDRLEEISCSTVLQFFPAGKTPAANDQCFQTSTKIYTWYMPKNMGDIFNNKSDQSLYIYEKDRNGVLGMDSYLHPLQGTTWNIPKDLFRWATVEEGGVEKKVTTDGQRFVREYPAKSSKLLIIANEGKGATFMKPGASTKANDPALMVEYITRHYSIQNGQLVGPQEHREFAFYKAAWCGDGIVDSEYGEQFDDGANNGKPGFASTDCKTKVPTPVPGICDGASNGVPTLTAPTNLCKTGTPSVVTEKDGKFTWSCGGVNGGDNVTCEAPKKPAPVPGICDGASNGVPTLTAPTNLCKTGTPSVVTEKDGKFTWSCGGVNGGDSVTCEAPKKPAPVPGICDGASNGVPTLTAPTNLCKTGTPSVVTEKDGKFTWSCGGVNGGDNVTCEAPKKTPTPVPGICDGASNGVPTLTAPTNLCKTGTPSVVTEKDGKFTWSCGGVNGGDNVTCEAPKKTTPPPTDLGGKCDQTFHDKLYLGDAVTFFDRYTNKNTFPHTLQGFSVDFRESDDMNKDKKSTFAENFDWVSPYKVGAQIPGGTKDAKILESKLAYRILQAPTIRKKDNIAIDYVVRISSQAGESSHKECITYEVAWCGDGIVDTDNGEQCDPNDPNKTNWGPGGCNPGKTYTNDGKDISCQPKQSPTLEIKKYAKGQDAQTAGNQVTIMPGEEYPYTFEVKNTSNVDAMGAKVIDNFPDAITVVKTGTGTDWTCTQEGQQMTCVYAKPIKAGATAPTITAIAKLKDTVKSGDSIRNVAGVCEFDPKKPVNDPNCIPNRDECKPGDANYNPTTKTCDPSTVTVGGELEIKKLVNGDDAQTADQAVSVEKGKTFTYTFNVKNPNTSAVKGAKIEDTFPTEIEVVKVNSGADWTCSQSGQTVTCLYNKEIPAGASLPSVTVEAKIRDNVELNKAIRNVVGVCISDPTKSANDPTQCKVKVDPCKPGDVNYNPTTKTCDPATVKITGVDLEIKKYVKSIDSIGDSQDKPVTIALGETFNYYYQFENKNSVAVNNVVLKDTFPLYLEHSNKPIIVKDPSGRDVTSDWTITRSNAVFNDGKDHIYVILKKKTPLPANSGKYTVEVPTKIVENAPNNTSLQNMVYICGDNVTGTPLDPTGKNVCDNDNPPQPPVPNQCTPENNPKQDPACIVIENGLDLSIKKYIDNDQTDAQPNIQPVVEKSTNATFNYVLRVKVESGKTTGTTTVKDILPTGVELNGAATGNDWTITMNGKTLTATSTQEVNAGSYFADIIVPVKVTAGNNQTVRNDATVHNPNEKDKPCYDNNRMPNGNEQSCSKDPKNTDPAIFKTPGATTVVSSGYNAVMCDGNTAVIRSYSDLASCNNDLNRITDSNKKSQCYTVGQETEYELRNDATRMAANYCVTTPTPTPTYYCGNGILEAGEMCDPGTGRGANNNVARAGTNSCSATCDLKVDPITNPGANEIDYFISIPGFAKTLGATSFNTGRTPFASNKMIIGKDSNIFTLADKVNLEVKTEYKAPVQLESTREFLISTSGEGLTDSSFQKRLFAGNANYTHNNVTYYVFGEGDLLVHSGALINGLNCDTPGAVYMVCRPAVVQSAISLFNGSDLQHFKGLNSGKAGNVHLSIKQRTGNGYTELVSFPVEVTSSKVATSGSSVNRKLESWTKTNFADQALNKFAKNSTTDTTSTNASIATNQVTPINVAIRNTGNVTISSASQLSNYTHNGNPNVYAIKGDLTINGNIELTGVKTILVEGNININGNIKYATNDANASWAFIAKGGNIKVANTVTDLQGTFVAIKEGNPAKGGEFEGVGATNQILRIDGTVYGDATKLFNSRTYARATGAYDTLTTGTVITYSNRALRNPPPLLSQYLNAYKVQRVTR